MFALNSFGVRWTNTPDTLMKSYFPIILMLVLGVLATSCNNSNQVVSNSIIQKRKHTKGFFLNIKKPRQHQVAKAKALEAPSRKKQVEAFVLKDTNTLNKLASQFEKSVPPSTKAATENSALNVVKYFWDGSKQATFKPTDNSIQPLKPQPKKIADEEENPDKEWSKLATRSILLTTFIPILLMLLGFAGAWIAYFLIPISIIVGMILGFSSFKDIARNQKKGIGVAIAAIIIGFIDIWFIAGYLGFIEVFKP